MLLRLLRKQGRGDHRNYFSGIMATLIIIWRQKITNPIITSKRKFTQINWKYVTRNGIVNHCPLNSKSLKMESMQLMYIHEQWEWNRVHGVTQNQTSPTLFKQQDWQSRKSALGAGKKATTIMRIQISTARLNNFHNITVTKQLPPARHLCMSST